MKKKFFLVLSIFVILFSLSGCKDDEEGYRAYTIEDMPNQIEQMELRVKLPMVQTDSEILATVTTDKGENLSFNSIADAWSNVCSRPDEELTITLFSDWVAQNGSFQTSDNQIGFGKTGGLDIPNRTRRLLVNLNGFTVNRALSQPIEAGSVFSFEANVRYVEIYDGNITGGNTLGRGGAAFINTKDNVCFDDVKIYGNHAKGNGGGLYIGTKKGWIWLHSVTVKENSSDNYGGGIYLDATTKNLFTDVYAELGFSGWAYVYDNVGKSQRENLTVRNSNTNGNARISYLVSIFDGSKIHINTSKNEANEYVTNTFSATGYGDVTVDQYFECDNPNFKFNTHRNINYENHPVIGADFKVEIVKK